MVRSKVKMPISANIAPKDSLLRKVWRAEKCPNTTKEEETRTAHHHYSVCIPSQIILKLGLPRAPYKFGTRSGVQTFSIATNFCVSSRRSIFQKGLLYCFSLLLHRSHTNYVNQLLFYRLVKFSTRYSTAVLIKTLVHSYYKNISVQNNKRGMGAMGKLSSHKHTPKNDDDVDDASDKYGPPSQIALGMRGFFI